MIYKIKPPSQDKRFALTSLQSRVQSIVLQDTKSNNTFLLKKIRISMQRGRGASAAEERCGEGSGEQRQGR